MHGNKTHRHQKRSSHLALPAVTIFLLAIIQNVVLGFVPPSDIPSSRSLHPPPIRLPDHRPHITSDISSRNRLVNRRSTRLHDKKWGPRWNPPPDSEYYRDRLDNRNIYGGKISVGLGRTGRRRRWRSRYSGKIGRLLTVQRLLVILNILTFSYQIYSAITYIPVLNSVLSLSSPTEAAFSAGEITEQFLLGQSPIVIKGRIGAEAEAARSILSRMRMKERVARYGGAAAVASTAGPFTMDFIHQQSLTAHQPHRYLTSGFLHSSLLHLLLNITFLSRLPKWIENNGGSDGRGWTNGWPLYLIAYTVGIVSGNWGVDYAAGGLGKMYLGASGGICGLQGLRFAMASRMENGREVRKVLKEMLVWGVVGSLLDGVSNAAHMSGFVGGILVGMVFGPTFTRISSYAASRGTLVGENDVPMEYRRVMAGRLPGRGLAPLKYLGVLGVLLCVYRPILMGIPMAVWTGIRRPGVLSGIVTSVVGS